MNLMYLSSIKTYPLDTSLVSEAEKRFAELKASKLAYLKLTESTDLWLRSLCPEKLDGHESVTLTENGVLVVNERGGDGSTRFNSFTAE